MNRELITVIEQIGREKGIDPEILFEALESALLSASKEGPGTAEAILTEREQIPGERYNPGDRIRAFVLEVRRTAKGPQISLSRTHPGYLARLFETEIPEIQEGIVVVKATAREAGERAKVAVASTKRDVDPIGACVGLRGTRLQVIRSERRGETIDPIG